MADVVVRSGFFVKPTITVIWLMHVTNSVKNIPTTSQKHESYFFTATCNYREATGKKETNGIVRNCLQSLFLILCSHHSNVLETMLGQEKIRLHCGELLREKSSDNYKRKRWRKEKKIRTRQDKIECEPSYFIFFHVLASFHSRIESREKKIGFTSKLLFK